MIRALCLALCWASVASAAEPAHVFVWDVPKPLEAIDVPERVQAGGVPVSIHAVRSKASPDELAASFRAQFEKAGLFLPPDEHLTIRSAHPQVTGLDVDTFIAYTVFLQDNRDGTTTVLFTETFLSERKKAADGVDFAPVMPGAKGVVTSSTEGLRVVSYRVRATREEAWAFHREVLKEADFKESAEGVFDRPGETLQLVVRPEREGEVAVSVMQTRHGEEAGSRTAARVAPLLDADDEAPTR